jgi:hypothetical protein
MQDQQPILLPNSIICFIPGLAGGQLVEHGQIAPEVINEFNQELTSEKRRRTPRRDSNRAR